MRQMNRVEAKEHMETARLKLLAFQLDQPQPNSKAARALALTITNLEQAQLWLSHAEDESIMAYAESSQAASVPRPCSVCGEPGPEPYYEVGRRPIDPETITMPRDLAERLVKAGDDATVKMPRVDLRPGPDAVCIGCVDVETDAEEWPCSECTRILAERLAEGEDHFRPRHPHRYEVTTDKPESLSTILRLMADTCVEDPTMISPNDTLRVEVKRAEK